MNLISAAYETYKEVVKKDNSVRLQDVKTYINSLDPVQTQFR